MRDVVIYDGTCGLCRREVQRIRRWDRNGRFDLLDLHAPDLLNRFPQLSGQDLNAGMRLMMADGRAFVGADAIAEILRQLPGKSWLAWLYRIPIIGRPARVLYAWVARHRKRL